MTVLILTSGGDSHAVMVAACLERLGEPVTLYSQAYVVGEGDISVSLDAAGARLSWGELIQKSPDQLTVWNRRNPRDYFWPSNIHPADKTFIRRSVDEVLSGIRVVLDDGFAVNPIASAALHSNKLNQLAAAARANVPFPKTLVSNDHEEICRFIQLNEVSCVKSLVGAGWKTETACFDTLTTLIRCSSEIDRASAEICPAIYQEYIAKAYEVRLTLFGNYSVASRMKSASDRGSIDWRADKSYLRNLEPVEIPQEVYRGARAIMASMGLRFGCFDYAASASGEWVFLEVNEAGQFLWQEHHGPDCYLLEPFARYLISRDDQFGWNPSQRSKALSTLVIEDEVNTSGYMSMFLAQKFAPEESMCLVSEAGDVS